MNTYDLLEEFRKRVVPAINEVTGKVSPKAFHTDTDEQYTRHLANQLGNIFAHTLLEMGKIEKEEVETTKEKIIHNFLNSNSSGKGVDVEYYRLRIETKHLFNSYKKIINEEHEILRLDKKNKRRFLRYRIYTAVGLATIVFFLALASKCANVPLPLSGVRQVVAAEIENTTSTKGSYSLESDCDFHG